MNTSNAGNLQLPASKCRSRLTTRFKATLINHDDSLGEVPWLFDILWYLPPTQNVHALERLDAKMMKARRENPQSSNQQDVAGHLVLVEDF